ncbi:hypothetical protein XBO1_1900013 [Xenorhabdus bovienii str. oregonense]|uniref:Uncharacterized protein n=1 Tax=Xenorhabdus bovienii str. oregonense TaxID=1398202 RepID=A0A077P6H6_XENBV|nr:hypothetical protein XBO1_1900013 [Xenorhabdus bovienii str. oregonense]
MFFPGLFRKSAEPLTSRDLSELIGLSYDTYSGRRVSPQLAMQLTAVFSCVRVLAESVGMLPCSLYEQLERGNPQADPTQEKIDVFYIDSKTQEDNENIQFSLSSPADLQGIKIPTRQIHSLCTWCIRGQYRKSPCGYTGTRYFDGSGYPTDDPAEDRCGGLMSDCKKRFGDTEQLPFGGFPGSALLRR